MKGFTIIELIVVITITLLLIGTGMYTYAQYTENRKLSGEIQMFSDVLRQAQARARSGDQGEYTACTNMTGYEVNIQQNRFIYNFCCNYSCGSNTLMTHYFPKNISASLVHDTYDLPAIYRLNSIGKGTNNAGLTEFYRLYFSATWQVTSIPTSTPVKFKNTVTDKCVNIMMNDIGVVSIGSEYSGSSC